MNETNAGSGAHVGAVEMSGIKTEKQREAFKKILQVLDEEGLNKLEKVIVLTGVIRRVADIE